jgi:hypothetical protein
MARPASAAAGGSSAISRRHLKNLVGVDIMTPRHDRNRRARLQRLGHASTPRAIVDAWGHWNFASREAVAVNAADAMVIITVNQRPFPRFGLRSPRV